MANATKLFGHTFVGAGYPDFATTWPGFSFTASGTINASGRPRPVVDGKGHGAPSKTIGGVVWRGRSTSMPGRPDYQADLWCQWRNPGGAFDRQVGLLFRMVDVKNCLAARLRSVLSGGTELRLFKIIGGAETQLGSTYAGIGSSAMAAGVRWRARVEDLQDGTGNTRVTLYKDPQGATGKGTQVLDWTGDLAQLRGAHTVGVELSGQVYWQDVYVDDLEVYDLSDEWAPSGPSPAPGAGWQIELGNTLYSTDDLNALFPATGTTDRAAWNARVRQGYGPRGNRLSFHLRGRFEMGNLLFPGQRVRALHDGAVRFRGTIAEGQLGLGASQEDQAWEAYDAYWAARQVRLFEDDLTGTLNFNVYDVESDAWQSSRQEMTVGAVLKFLFNRYTDGASNSLRFYGAAPPVSAAYVQAELDALDAVINDVAVTGTFIEAVETLLKYMPKFQVWVDPNDLTWHFRDVTTLDAESISLTAEWVELRAKPDRDKAFTQVEWRGSKREASDGVTYELADGSLQPAWTQEQEATHHDGKRHRGHISVKILASGTGVAPDGVMRNYLDVAASYGIDPDDWRGAVVQVNGFQRFVVANTSTRFWLSSPDWATPPSPGDVFTIVATHPDAIPALMAVGVGRAFFLPIASVCGTEGSYQSGLKHHGFCGQAFAEATGEDGIVYSQEYQFRVAVMNTRQQAAGFCKPVVILSEKPKPPIGIVNYLPPAGGSPPKSSCVAGNSNAPSRIPQVNVKISVSRNEETAAIFREPPDVDGRPSFRGPAHSDDPANWDGGGQPSGTDWGVTQVYTVDDPDFVDSSQIAGLRKAAAATLALKSQKPYLFEIRLASPWVSVPPAFVQPAQTSRFAGLSKRVTISSAKRTTGYESAAELMVFNVEWDIQENATTLEAGTASAWLSPAAQDVAKAFSEKPLLRKMLTIIKDVEDFRNRSLVKNEGRVGGVPGSPIDGCDVRVINENVRRVVDVQKDDQDKQAWIGHQALRQKIAESLFQGVEQENPGAPIEVPGLDGDAAQLVHDGGPVLRSAARHDAPFAGPPAGVTNAATDRYGGLPVTDATARGEPPREIMRVAGYAFRKALDAGGRHGGSQDVEVSPTGTDGAPTGPWTPYRFRPSDLPSGGRTPLQSLPAGGSQHQLLERSAALARAVGAVEDDVRQILAPGETGGAFSDGAPADVMGILRAGGAVVPGLRPVPQSFGDPGGLVLQGPMSDTVDAGLLWRVLTPEMLLVRVEAVTPGTGTNGGAWAWWTGGPGGTMEFLSGGGVVHKQAHQVDMAKDGRHPDVPVVAAAANNPFGNTHEGLELNSTGAGAIGGVTAVLAVPSGARAVSFIANVKEDATHGGAALPAGTTFQLQIDHAYQASPWSAISAGTPTNVPVSDGAKTGTGQFLWPGGSVPPGLRSVGVSVVYTPGGGGAPANAPIIVTGIGVDVAVVEGGYLLRMVESIEVTETWRNSHPHAGEGAALEDEWSLQPGKVLTETLSMVESWDVQLNPPVLEHEVLEISEAWAAETGKALDDALEVAELWVLELNP